MDNAGATVRIVGLTKAAQHNGKVGKISARPAEQEGRIGVELGEGVVLAVRRENLELVAAAPVPNAGGAMAPEGNQRTLKHDNGMLIEFNGSADPDVLVLYHHLRDRAFDCFNASEYNEQMLRYYSANMRVVAVLSRQLQQPGDCFLVCLQHAAAERNTLCELAFQCKRSFTGISMLVKTRCFACNKPGARRCACQCACFCSKECEASDCAAAHKKVCKLIRASSVTVDDECVQLLS